MEKKFVYGLTGLCELLNCSHSTAYKIKRDSLKGTYAQVGRKLIFDVEKVIARLGMEA